MVSLDNCYTENDLINFMNTHECIHHIMWTNEDASSTCAAVSDRIIMLSLSGFTFSDDFIDEFIKYIKKSDNWMDHHKQCIIKSAESIADAFCGMIENRNIPTRYIYVLLECESIYYNKCVYKYVDMYPDTKFISSVINIVIQKHITDKKLIQTILDHIDINKYVIDKVLSCSNPVTHKTFSNYIKDSKIIKKAHLYKACNNLMNSKYTVCALIDKKMQLNSKCIDIVCQNKKIKNLPDVMNFILNYKIPIRKKNFKTLIDVYKDCKYDIKYWWKSLLLFIDYGYVITGYDVVYALNNDVPLDIKKLNIKLDNIPIDKTHFKALIDRDNIEDYLWHDITRKDTTKILQLMLEYGYIPDYDDVIYALVNGTVVPNIEKYNITADQKMLDICRKNNIYPTYDFGGISKDLVALQGLCTNRKSGELKKFFDKRNVIPDKVCMENVCTYKNNMVTLNLLLSHGGKVTYECIRKCGSKHTSNKMLLKLIDEYEINYNLEIDRYKKKINQLKKKLAKMKKK